MFLSWSEAINKMDLKYKIGFAVTAIASILLVIIILYDIVLLQERFAYLFLTSIGLLLICISLFLYMFETAKKQVNSVFLFEKTLQGGLYHYKCSVCNGMFAVKESRQNEINNLTLTCPDCGAIGRISNHSQRIIEPIPTEKSPRISFICTKCGERINIWAEGKPLFNNICIFSCPYCGSQTPMKPQ